MSVEIRPLTSLRFFLALWVLFFHLRGSINIYPWFGSLLTLGYMAVPGFFVLSGTVLTWTYFNSWSKPLDLRKYFRARFARIFPLYLLGFALGLPLFLGKVMAVGTSGWSLIELIWPILAVLVMIQAWIPSWVLSVNSPAWSLSAEAFFYAVFPWLGERISQAKTSVVLVIVGTAVLISGAIAWSLAPWIDPPGLSLPANQVPSRHMILDVLRFNPAVHLMDFVIGICVGFFIVRQRILSSWILYGCFFVGGGGLILMIVFSEHIPFLLANGLLASCCFALVIRALAGLPEKHLLHQVLSFSPLLLLGRSSYALYILHVPLLDWEWQAAKHLMGQPGQPLMFGAGFASVAALSLIGVSVLCHWWIEEPLRRRLTGKQGEQSGASVMVK